MLALHLLHQSRRRTIPLQRANRTMVRIFYSVLTQVLVAVDAVDGKTKVSSTNEATW
jgi:hypothetical protein